MWLLVMFDLPVKTRIQRKRASQFRHFLLRDGYTMLQLSNYARVCNGIERSRKHIERLKLNLPSRGSVRLLHITDKQYNRMELLVGEPKEKRRAQREKEDPQLVLF